ncbi:36850_t:CDS:2, partial [Gigaspora margarita]
TYSSYKIKHITSLWCQNTQDISMPNLESSIFEAIQSMLFRKSKRIKKFNILVMNNSTFPSISNSLFSLSKLKECEFKFVVLNGQNMNTIRIIAYNADTPSNCQEPFLNLITNQTNLKELELNYFITSSFIHLRREILQLKSQSLRKLVLQGIKFNKDNIAYLVPNLEVLSIRSSFGNPLGEGQNILNHFQKLELVDNDVELNKIMFKAKCKALKFFIIFELELSNEVKEELIIQLNLNYPNITTLCYVTDNLIFFSTLKKFQKLCQLQIGNLLIIYLIINFLPNSLKILNLFNINDYNYENLNWFLQDFDVKRMKLEVLILPFNIELDLLNLRKFVEKAKYLRHLKIMRLKNYNVEKQKV